MPTDTAGNRSDATHTGTADAVIISGGLADTNLSTQATSGGDRFLLKFTGLSGITGPVTVSAASITLYVATGQGSSVTVTAKRILQNWVENQATWNNYATSSPWGTPGCALDGTDRVAANSCDFAYAGGFATGDITSGNNTTLIADVEGFINLTLNNYGWVIDSGAVPVSFGLPANTDTGSSPADSTGRRPKLTITYTTGGGGQPPRTVVLFGQMQRR